MSYPDLPELPIASLAPDAVLSAVILTLTTVTVTCFCLPRGGGAADKESSKKKKKKTAAGAVSTSNGHHDAPPATSMTNGEHSGDRVSEEGPFPEDEPSVEGGPQRLATASRESRDLDSAPDQKHHRNTPAKQLLKQKRAELQTLKSKPNMNNKDRRTAKKLENQIAVLADAPVHPSTGMVRDPAALDAAFGVIPGVTPGVEAPSGTGAGSGGKRGGRRSKDTETGEEEQDPDRPRSGATVTELQKSLG